MNTKFQKVQLVRRSGKSSRFWYLRWFEQTERGLKEHWKSTKTELKREAEQLRHRLERELEAGHSPVQDLTWPEFVTNFLETHAGRKPRTTLDTYRNCLDAFGKVSRTQRAADVDFNRLEDYVKVRLKAGIARATINRDLRHLRATLQWGARRKLIESAPDFHGLFLREDLKRPTVVPKEDFAAMIGALNQPDPFLKTATRDWWRVFLYLSYYLGLRRNETLKLTWQDVSLETLEVRVMASTSKGRKERTVPIAKEIGELLKDWRGKNSGTQANSPVLPWHFDSYFPLYGDWHRIQTAAGIPAGQHYVPKNFRSSCASDLIASNVPTVVVKDFLGHATVATTENYYINTKPALRAAASAREVYKENLNSKSPER